MNNHTHFTDEDIIRYIDRELPPERLVAFEKALGSDANLSDKLNSLQSSDRQLRGYAALASTQPAPALDLDSASVNTATRAVFAPAWPMALAASVLAGAVGILIGMQIANTSTKSSSAALDSPMTHALFTALETQVQGNTTTWMDPATTQNGEITVTRTWQLDSGTWCREYEQRITIDGRREVETGAACRESDDTWSVQMKIFPQGGEILRRTDPSSI